MWGILHLVYPTPFSFPLKISGCKKTLVEIFQGVEKFEKSVLKKILYTFFEFFLKTLLVGVEYTLPDILYGIPKKLLLSGQKRNRRNGRLETSNIHAIAEYVT